MIISRYGKSYDTSDGSEQHHEAPPQPADASAPRLLRLALDVRWGETGAGENDARTHLHLESLRLVRPDAVAVAPP